MAATNIAQFSLGIRRFQEHAENRRRQMTKAVALEALKGLVKGTRFDTGRAKGNWQVGETSPPEGHDPDLKDPNGATTISVGTREILATAGDDIIWLHNGVPYIGVLEDKDKMLVGNVERLRTWIASR